MITAIEYETMHGGVRRLLHADKDVKTRNAWHLATISGNELPPVSVIGETSYSLPGRSYNGVSIDSREIEVELYADGLNAMGLQTMLTGLPSVISLNSDALGVLRLTNAAGEVFRIGAKCTDFSTQETMHSSMLFSGVFECPQPFFESDVLYSAPVFAVTGGKEYPLTRPYTFGDIISGSGEQSLELFNAGDVVAPCVIKLFGAGLTNVTITNATTGATIEARGMPSVGGIEISTDVDNLYMRFADGTDASAYVSLVSDVTAFHLAPGANDINVSMTATSVTPAGTSIEWRGRYTTCL